MTSLDLRSALVQSFAAEESEPCPSPRRWTKASSVPPPRISPSLSNWRCLFVVFDHEKERSPDLDAIICLTGCRAETGWRCLLDPCQGSSRDDVCHGSHGVPCHTKPASRQCVYSVCLCHFRCRRVASVPRFALKAPLHVRHSSGTLI